MDITVLILTVLLAASIALLGVLLRRTGRQGSELHAYPKFCKRYLRILHKKKGKIEAVTHTCNHERESCKNRCQRRPLHE